MAILLPNNKYNVCVMGSFHIGGLLLLLGHYVQSAHSYACPIKNGIFVASCENQGLKYIPWDLPHSISMFHLENNNFSQLSGTPFFKFTYMEELWLRNNSLSKIEESVFQGCKSLKYIDMAKNALATIPTAAFKNTPKLTNLNLNENKITYIGDDAFVHLDRLQNLYLKGNKIHAISPKAFTGLTSLRWLELQNNLLRKLDPGTVQPFRKKFLAIKLYQNLWHCDCTLRWLKSWLTGMAENYTLHWEFDLARPTCHSPWLVEEKAFSDIPDSFFVCPVHILSQSSTLVQKMTSTGQIMCEVNADPPATVFWFKGKTIIRPEDTYKYEVVNEGTNKLKSTLLIYNFQMEDMGVYSCRAVNPAGAHNVSFVVTLEGVDPASVHHVKPVTVKTNLNVVTVTAIVVGSLVMILAVIAIVCIMIYRRRSQGDPHRVQTKVTDDAQNANGDVRVSSEQPYDPDEEIVKEHHEEIDPLYESVRVRNLQNRNSLNTSTYISFKSEPSDPEDLSMLYSSMPKRRYYNSSVTSAQTDSISPLLVSTYVTPPRAPYRVDPLYESTDYSTIPLHLQHTHPYASTPPLPRTHHPQKSVSMGSLGLTPPKKPPRLYAGSRDTIKNNSSCNTSVGTISSIRNGDSYSTAV